MILTDTLIFKDEYPNITVISTMGYDAKKLIIKIENKNRYYAHVKNSFPEAGGDYEFRYTGGDRGYSVIF